MKIANIYREIVHNFWPTSGVSMKFSGKMCFMIISKVTKNQGFTLCLEDIIFENLQGGVKLINFSSIWNFRKSPNFCWPKLFVGKWQNFSRVTKISADKNLGNLFWLIRYIWLIQSVKSQLEKVKLSRTRSQAYLFRNY